MTSFLRLNGIAVPVDAKSAELDQKDIGTDHEAADGTPIVNRRATKRSWQVSTILRSVAEALAWRDLVTGKGHVLSWENNNHYTSKGLAPSSVGVDFTISTSNPKFGTRRAASAATTTNKAAWPMFTATSPWSIAVYDTIDAGATYHHYFVDSIGRKWVDGARNDAASTPFLAVSAGVVTLGVTSVAHGFDDFFGFPQLVDAGWPAQMFAYGAAVGELWRLKADGLFIEQNSTILVQGKAGKMKAVKAATGLLHSLSFELHEL